MAQGVLPVHHEADRASTGVTALGGLPLCLELIEACRLPAAIRREMAVCGSRGWRDTQMPISALALNLAGGDCVDDLERPERDSGFTAVPRAVELSLSSRRERRETRSRWRRERQRTLPSPSSMRERLGRCHDAAQEAERVAGKAVVPVPSEALHSLWRVNDALPGFVRKRRRKRRATLDMDATLIESHKRQALHGCKACQPLNRWWAERGAVLHSEFRDGDVPAGFERLRVLKDGLAKAAAPGVKKVAMRSDSAVCQQDLLPCCGEGEDERFGMIDFAVSVDVTAAFGKEALAVEEAEWKPLMQRDRKGRLVETGQEGAETGFVPDRAGCSKKPADYRFHTIREPLRQLDLGDDDRLPFPTRDFLGRGRCKLSGVVTNLRHPGDEVIRWHRGRCGKSGEVHTVLKGELAGGQMPSGPFGANAAWWAIAILDRDLNATMKRLAPGSGWTRCRMKALRFHLIALPGRVVRHARRRTVRLSAAGRTMAPAHGPSGQAAPSPRPHEPNRPAQAAETLASTPPCPESGSPPAHRIRTTGRR